MTIKILTGYEGSCPYAHLALANFTEYSTRWGHTLVSQFADWPPLSRSIEPDGLLNFHIRRMTWRKHTLIHQELKDCDWLLWLDPDCLILNMATSLTAFCTEDHDLIVTGPYYYAPPCTHPMYSVGILFLRNCEWTEKFLDEWWTLEDSPWRIGETECCKTEGDANWFSCHYMQRPDRSSRIKILDPRVAGTPHWLDSPDQFIMHLHGSPPEGRLTEMQWCSKQVRR